MGGEDIAVIAQEKGRNLKGGRGVNSMNLNNNSMNSSSLQNHYKGNNSNLFA